MAVATAPRAGATAAVPAGPAAAERPSGRGSSAVGMAVFAAADAMLFVGLLAAYFAVRAEAFRWPPAGVHLDYYLPTMVTFTAVLSSVSAAWAMHANRWNDRRHVLTALLLTAGFGLAMANGLWFVNDRAGFAASKHAYATLFLSLNVFSLANVLVGLAVLAVAALRTGAGHFNRRDHDFLSAAVGFWEFVVLVWTTSFTVVWLFR